MASDVKVKDKGAVKLLAAAKKHPVVDIGVIGAKAAAKHGQSKATVALIASVHEFGLGNCPRRSFIADWFDEDRPEMTAFVKRLVSLFTQGKITEAQFVTFLGEKAKSGIQTRMARNIPPPLKAATVARKGSSMPLIDEGILRASITYRQVKP